MIRSLLINPADRALGPGAGQAPWRIHEIPLRRARRGLSQPGTQISNVASAGGIAAPDLAQVPFVVPSIFFAACYRRRCIGASISCGPGKRPQLINPQVGSSHNLRIVAVWQTAKKATEEQSMMRGIVAKLKATASDDQVTKTATEQQEEAIYAYVDALPELHRTMFLMRIRDGQTYVEIAEALGLGRKVVLKSLAKMYSELRISLEPSD